MSVVGGMALLVVATLGAQMDPVPKPSQAIPQTGAAASAVESDTLLPAADLPGVKGVLRIAHYTDAPVSSNPKRHKTTYVNVLNNREMEDNDLRGYLDGGFKYGWNQVSQIHVRIGRRGKSPRWGEFELFRVLQRWSKITLPDLAQAIQARLTVFVEKDPPAPVRVLLYNVVPDWNPGGGGLFKNNNSPPRKGEVWWNDVGYGEQSWGLPGANYAPVDAPDADTGAMPLADAVYTPGDQELEFSSDELAQYINEQIRLKQPLRFLLKLSDYQEDIPGSLLNVYSGNHGDSRNPARRPQLTIEWESRGEKISRDKLVFLEHGRSYVLREPITRENSWHAVSFRVDPGYEQPIIEVRGGIGDEVTPWTRVTQPFQQAWDWMEIRLWAGSNPVLLGEPFESEFADTWVRTRAPEDQVVPWVFVSPTGMTHTVHADYLGDYHWKTKFLPDEVGPWRYSWSQTFLHEPFHSAIGSFDVVLDDPTQARKQLEAFVEKVSSTLGSNRKGGSNSASKGGNISSEDEALRYRLMMQFSRLERAVMQLETPESFRSDSGQSLKKLLKAARALLGGQPVPDSLPLIPDHPPPWKRKSR